MTFKILIECLQRIRSFELEFLRKLTFEKKIDYFLVPKYRTTGNNRTLLRMLMRTVVTKSYFIIYVFYGWLC